MLPFRVLVSVFPFFDVSGKRNIRLLGVVVRIGRRHPGSCGARYPCGRAAARIERDGGTPRALTLIVARRDRKHIITVPFNHFCIQFLLHARVERSHSLVFTYASLDTCLYQQAGASIPRVFYKICKYFFVLTVEENIGENNMRDNYVTRVHSIKQR